MLAQQLMAEIQMQAYADPDYGEDDFGLAAGKVTGNRSLWDDVDDYDGWSASPPQYKDGTALSGLVGWERSVTVDWVGPLDLSQVVGSNQGAKRIIVTVTRDDAVVARLTAIRTSSWPSAEDYVDPTVTGVCGSGGGVVKGAETVNQAPIAVAEGTPLSGMEPLTVTFTGENSSDPDAGDTLTYFWDFGDGVFSTDMNPQHEFMQGDYVVTLVVADQDGATGSDTVQIKVSAGGK
jgi:PKD repeat protein